MEDLGLLAVVESEQDLEDDEFDLEVVEESIRFEQPLGIFGDVVQDQG